MSHPNAKLLRGIYEAFGHGDLDPLLGALTDDISWHDSAVGPAGRAPLRQGSGPRPVRQDDGGLRRNPAAGGRRFLRQRRPRRGADPGGRFGRGKQLSWTGVHLWGFRDGRCARFTAYADADYQRFWSTKNPDAATWARS
jgi:ketosteroid isomerase-like protein